MSYTVAEKKSVEAAEEGLHKCDVDKGVMK